MTDMPQFPESYWRESTELPSFPKLKKSKKIDVGIVGAGITGITAAYLLSKHALNIAVIDAGRILNGTTGHTTAKITAQHGLIYDEFIRHFGQEKTALYYEANKRAGEFIKQTIDKYNIDCDFSQEDAYIYTNSHDYLTPLENERKAYEKIGIDHEMSDILPLTIPIKSALIMKNQAQFHPLKYLRELINKCVENGVEFYENTTAIDIEYNNHPAIVTREGERLVCRYVIQASHYPFYDGQGFYPTRMYMDRSYVLALKTNQAYPGGMYISAETPTRSLRRTTIAGEDLWIVSGEGHKTGQGKSTIKHYEALKQFTEENIANHQILYRWSAQDLVTLDKLPYIGPVTKNQPSVFVATGFRKWGMTNGTNAALLLSELITKEDSAYRDLFTPSRFHADPALRKFMNVNLDVAKHLIKGKLEYTEGNLDDLKTDEATVVRINGKRTGAYKDINNELHLVDTTCTHLGCEVEWNSGDRTWDCPCHGSRFSYEGEIISGPAKKPLTRRIIKE